MLATFLVLAATYIVPPDAEMIQKADAIVIATAVQSVADAKNTRVTLHVEETLKGDIGSELVLTEMGGTHRFIAGAPRYETGQRYLVFTETNRDLEPVTFGLALGQFRIDGDRAVRNDVSGFDRNLAPYVERDRDMQRFLRFVRETIAGRFASADYFVSSSKAATSDFRRYSRTSYLMQENDGIGYRWPTPVATVYRNGTQPGVDGKAAFDKALEQWNATDSNIAYANGGENTAATKGLDEEDGFNAVLFNDPNGEIIDHSSVAGIGGSFGGTKFTFENETFYDIVEGDVVVANRELTQSCLDTIVTHELGHTLGFRHSNEVPKNAECDVTAQCTHAAVMNASIYCPYAGVLQQWDKDAAATVYGSGATCGVPQIVTQPKSRKQLGGSYASLSVEADGTAPLHYQWLEDGVPVGTDSRFYESPQPLYRTTTYRVVVTNECGSTASDPAVIEIPTRRRSARH